MTVVDASVAVKWFLPETGADAALQLHGQELAAPALIRVEVAAAIVRKARSGEIAPEEAERAVGWWLKSLAEGSVTLVPDQTGLPNAVRLALALHHPLQDCLYLATASRCRAPLITADQKFAARARTASYDVRLLQELTS
jgi:predicted nucleic acid-binding protein